MRSIEQIAHAARASNNDLVNSDAIGASERDIQRASMAIRWLAVAALGVALAVFHVVSASAGELVGHVAGIADGDTLTVLNAGQRQLRIRLADIDAPERKQPFGTRSRQSLAELRAAKVADVEHHGLDRYGRTIGHVICAGVDVNAEHARRGMAWVYRKYALKRSILYGIEDMARISNCALWADSDPTPSWEWRSARWR